MTKSKMIGSVMSEDIEKQMIEIAGKFLLIVKCLGGTKQFKASNDSKIEAQANEDLT